MRRHFVDYFLDTFSKVTLQNHYMIVGHFFVIIQQCKNKMCCIFGDVIFLSLQNVRGDKEEIQSTCMFCSEYSVYCINKTNVEAANRSRHMVRFNCIEDSQKFLLRLSKLKQKQEAQGLPWFPCLIVLSRRLLKIFAIYMYKNLSPIVAALPPGTMI